MTDKITWQDAGGSTPLQFFYRSKDCKGFGITMLGFFKGEANADK